MTITRRQVCDGNDTLEGGDWFYGYGGRDTMTGDTGAALPVRR